MSDVNQIKELFYKRKKTRLLEDIAITSESGDPLEEVLSLIITDEKDIYLKRQLKSIKEEYERYEKEFSFILVYYNFITEDELIFFQESNMLSDVINNIIKNRKTKSFSIEKLVVIELFPFVILLFSSFLFLPFLLENFKELYKKIVNLLNIDNNIKYPYIINNPEIFYFIALITGILLFLTIFSYYYLKKTNISLFYKLFRTKGYEEFHKILNFLIILSNKKMNDSELSLYISKNIGNTELRKFFHEISEKGDSLIYGLLRLNFPSNIVSRLIKYHENGTLYQLNNFNNNELNIETLCNICEYEIEKNHNYYKKDFMFFGLKYFSFLILASLLVLLYISLSDLIEAIISIVIKFTSGGIY